MESAPSPGVIQHGEIFHLDELVQQGSALDGKSVRVIGRIGPFDVETGHVVITNRMASCQVDASPLSNINLREGSLFQFIGEVDCRPGSSIGEVILRARVARNMDGLDELLFEKALALRREFERSHGFLLGRKMAVTELSSPPLKAGPGLRQPSS